MPDHVAAEVKNVLVFPFDGSEAIAVDDFAPTDPSRFGISIQVFIGEPGGDDVDSFDVVVCSPSWFTEQAATDAGWARLVSQQHETDAQAVLAGTGLWFMRRWSSEELSAALSAVCRAASGGPDWGTVAARIGRAIPWEYDYEHDAHLDGHYGAPFPFSS